MNWIRHGLWLALASVCALACEPAFDASVRPPSTPTVSLEFLRVESAQATQTDSTLTFALTFSQPLSDGVLAQHTAVTRVEAPMADGRPVGSRMALEVTGQERSWEIRVAAANILAYGYVLVVGRDLTSRGGQYLDGAVPGSTGTAARQDDDYYQGPEDFISAMIGPVNAVGAHAMRTDHDRPRLHDLQLYRQISGGAAYDTFFRQPFQKIIDRADLTPALPTHDLAYRMEFTAPTWFEALMDPLKVATEIRFVDALGGARRPRFSYNADYVNEVQVGAPYAVTGAQTIAGTSYVWLEDSLGETIEGPTLNENPGDEIYLYVGEAAAGTAPLFRVVGYERYEKRLTLSHQLLHSAWSPVTGGLHLPEPVMPEGVWSGQLWVRFADGSTDVVLGHDRQTYVLARGTPAAALVTAAVIFELPPLEQWDLELPVRSFFVARHVYAFGLSALENGTLFTLTVGLDDVPRNLFGVPLSDSLRDGDERRLDRRDDRVEINLSILPAATAPIPLTMLLNDGSLYPTLFAERGLTCQSPAPLCVQSIERRSGCTEDILWFSFYTPDGNPSNPKGDNDLIRSDGLREQPIAIFRDRRAGVLDGVYDSEIPIQWSLETVVAQPAPADNFIGGPATLVRASPLAECARFEPGDQIIVRHTIPALIEDRAVTFDGDGDGVSQSTAEDDFVAWYAGVPTGFVSLAQWLALSNP